MEESQNTENQTQEAPQVSSPVSSGVSFPTIGEPKKSGGAKTLLVVGILVLVGILGFVIYKSAAKNSETPIVDETTYDNMVETVPTEPTASASPSATPKAADKEDVKIQVQNGTGITGEAAYLETQLKGLGYTEVAVGNSAKQDLTATQVSFGSSVDSTIVSEITTKLKALYQSVTTTTSASTTYDIVIVTGLRKGATAKPSASPTASPSSSPSASPTPTTNP